MRSWRSERVARWFGLVTGEEATAANNKFIGETSQSLPLPETGQLLLITGASGSGKSTLLRQIVAELQRTGRRVIDLARLPLPDVPVVDCLPDLPLEEALMLLGRMGLGEAWTYLRTPAELSDGQRWRLRLAIAVHEAGRDFSREGASDSADHSLRAGGVVIVCDEFAALLDRVTAAVVSRSIRKVIDALPGLSAVVATSHDDVRRPLAPDRTVHCDFGEFRSAANCKLQNANCKMKR